MCGAASWPLHSGQAEMEDIVVCHLLECGQIVSQVDDSAVSCSVSTVKKMCSISWQYSLFVSEKLPPQKLYILPDL